MYDGVIESWCREARLSPRPSLFLSCVAHNAAFGSMAANAGQIEYLSDTLVLRADTLQLDAGTLWAVCGYPRLFP